jgi:phosphatidylserine synthase
MLSILGQIGKAILPNLITIGGRMLGNTSIGSTIRNALQPEPQQPQPRMASQYNQNNMNNNTKFM